MKGRKPNTLIAGDINAVPSPPRWLSNEGKREWKRVLPGLVARRMITAGDMALVEAFCVAAARVRELEIERQHSGSLDPKLFRMQNQAAQTMRQIAAEIGLSPVSRTKAAREEAEDENSPDNPNPLLIGRNRR